MHFEHLLLSSSFLNFSFNIFTSSSSSISSFNLLGSFPFSFPISFNTRLLLWLSLFLLSSLSLLGELDLERGLWGPLLTSCFIRPFWPFKARSELWENIVIINHYLWYVTELSLLNSHFYAKDILTFILNEKE